jgi:mannose-6-phosphate isomerase-like protein (cupin superfamily)
MNVRRVLVGNNDAGRTVVLSDGPTPHSHDFVNVPGQAMARIWRTPGEPSLIPPDEEPTSETGPLLPGPGGLAFIILTVAPDAVMQSPDLNWAAAGAEFATYAADIAAAADPETPGLHRHHTLDFFIVLAGELWLEVDDGAQVRLEAGDTVVHIDGRHAWHNKTDTPARVAIVTFNAEGR